MTNIKSNKWEEATYWMTICTPTYQRVKTLNRVYYSLLKMNVRKLPINKFDV